MRRVADFSIRAALLVCSRETVTLVVEPAVADVEYERWQHDTHGERRRAQWVAVRGYAKVIAVVLMALPRDLVTHRRPDAADVLRLVTGIALGGVSPTFGTGPLLRMMSPRPPDQGGLAEGPQRKP